MHSPLNLPDKLEEELNMLAIKHNISLLHLYSLIDQWIYALVRFATNGLYPTIIMDNFFTLQPRVRSFRLRVRKLWYLYRNGNERRKIAVRDPFVAKKLLETIKIYRRLKIEAS